MPAMTLKVIASPSTSQPQNAAKAGTGRRRWTHAAADGLDQMKEQHVACYGAEHRQREYGTPGLDRRHRCRRQRDAGKQQPHGGAEHHPVADATCDTSASGRHRSGSA